jgi:hypothetical protein
MTVTREISTVGLAREAIAFYQSIDPLRGKVTTDLRVDLNKPHKHNGTVTFVAQPQFFKVENTEFAGFNLETEYHADFHAYIQSFSIWSLAFSHNTAQAFVWLSGRDDALMVDLAVELYPSDDNKFLGRAHGKPGTYTGGCRGPLCRAANTQAQRKRYLGKTPDLDRQKYEAALMQITESYSMYMQYIRQIREYRRSMKNGGQHVHAFMMLTLRDTILIDATDESYLLD